MDIVVFSTMIVMSSLNLGLLALCLNMQDYRLSHSIYTFIKYHRATIYRRLFPTLWPPSPFLLLHLVPFYFYSHMWYVKSHLIWNCIHFPDFSRNILWSRPAPADTVCPEKRKIFLSLRLDSCGAVALFMVTDCQSQHLI